MKTKYVNGNIYFLEIIDHCAGAHGPTLMQLIGLIYGQDEEYLYMTPWWVVTGDRAMFERNMEKMSIEVKYRMPYKYETMKEYFDENKLIVKNVYKRLKDDDYHEWLAFITSIWYKSREQESESERTYRLQKQS
jgi:hypothetical protein